MTGLRRSVEQQQFLSISESVSHQSHQTNFVVALDLDVCIFVYLGAAKNGPLDERVCDKEGEWWWAAQFLC